MAFASLLQLHRNGCNIVAIRVNQDKHTNPAYNDTVKTLKRMEVNEGKSLDEFTRHILDDTLRISGIKNSCEENLGWLWVGYEVYKHLAGYHDTYMAKHSKQAM